MRTRQALICVLTLMGLSLVSTASARAGQTVYATSLEGQKIVQVDIDTNVVTTVANFSKQVDSLLFSDPTHIVFTGINDGTVNVLNLTTNTSNVIASGLNGPRDLVLSADSSYVLVSDFGNSRIEKITLDPAHTVTNFKTGIQTDGLTLGAGGALYAVVGRSVVEKLDATTGAVLGTSLSLGNNLDGIAFDATTGHLFVTNFNGGTPGGILEIDPASLSLVRTYNGPNGGDGIASDGLGNLLIASRDYHVYKLTLATNTLSQRTFVSGLDDLAPVTGLGAPAPEPSTLVMAAAAVAFGLAAVRRRKMTTRA